jgi:hypothetical protein
MSVVEVRLRIKRASQNKDRYTEYMPLLVVAKRMNRAAKYASILLVSIWLYGTPLPRPDDVLPEIKRHTPSQETLSRTEPWKSVYGDYTYTFRPYANYELTGLVVSLHHSDSFVDISHAHDPAQTMDICVVWGKNITSGAYQEVSYDHGDFTCFYHWDGPTIPDFRADQIANTHMIPLTPDIAERLKSVRIGDQITMTGTLADYEILHQDLGQMGSRRTSLVRTDTGNGACEILLVQSLTLLKKNVPWRTPAVLVCIGIILLSILVSVTAYIKRSRPIMGTLTGKPHVENPYDIKSFLGKRGLLPKRHPKGGPYSHTSASPSDTEHIDPPTNAPLLPK